MPDERAGDALRSRPPNVVLIVADDLSWHDSGPYGATDVWTPNLDALAAGGITFRQAFSASPTCAPSRSATYTGLMPFRNGAHANHTLIHEGVRTLPERMRALGYRVAIAGKTHVGPREQFSFEFVPGTNVMPPGKSEFLWIDLNTEAVDAFLGAHDRATPLCLVVGTHAPHVYWEETNAYDPAEVTLPPTHVDTPETRAARCRYYADVEHLDRQVGELTASLRRHGFDENTLVAFTTDHGAQWPFAKWTLYDAGIRAPLLVRWPGVVGEGRTTDALVSLVDLVPTFVEAAGGVADASLDGRSLVPVLTGDATTHRDAVFAAHTGDREMNRAPSRCVRTDRFKYVLNLAPEIRFTTHISEGGVLDGLDYWQSWERAAETDPNAAAIVERYRHPPAEALYDVVADPHETTNLADDPAHAATLAGLRERLKRWRIEQGEDLTRVPMPEDGRHGELPYAG